MRHIRVSDDLAPILEQLAWDLDGKLADLEERVEVLQKELATANDRIAELEQQLEQSQTN